MNNYDLQQKRLESTNYIVHGAGSADFFLWQEWHEKVKWEQDNPGFSEVIGYLVDKVRGELPVNISISFQLINGYRILFWEVVSVASSLYMVEEYFDKHCSGVPRTDAMNFGHVIHWIRKEEERRIGI